MESLEQQWNKSILSLNLNQNKGLEGLIQATKVFFLKKRLDFQFSLHWLINLVHIKAWSVVTNWLNPSNYNLNQESNKEHLLLCYKLFSV